MIHKISSIIKLLSFFSLFILSYEQFQQQCTLGKNCPFNQGICVSNFCRCYEGYVTLNDVSLPPEKQIYCNYQQKSQYTPIILEIFLPCIGHFVVGNYWIGLLKFSLILSFILSSLSLYGEIRIPPLLIILFNKLGLSSILSKEDNKKEEEEEPEPRSRFRGRKNSDSDFPLAMEEKVEGEKTDNDNEVPKYKVARQAYDEGEEPENQEKLIPKEKKEIKEKKNEKEVNENNGEENEKVKIIFELTGILASLMYFMDLFLYKFKVYTDGNGVSFI